MSYKFYYNEKEYELNEKNFKEFYNDEEKPVIGIDTDKVINILNNNENVNVEKAYYGECCETCKEGKVEEKKFFDYLEINFYIFTKNGEFVISNIEKEYEGLSFNKLLKQKKVDNSYIVTVSICKYCGEYSIIIEEIDI